MSEVVRIVSIIIFHVNKLWNAEFFILYVILLVRLQGKFDLDHSWERKSHTRSHTGRFATPIRNTCFPRDFGDMLHLVDFCCNDYNLVPRAIRGLGPTNDPGTGWTIARCDWHNLFGKTLFVIGVFHCVVAATCREIHPAQERNGRHYSLRDMHSCVAVLLVCTFCQLRGWVNMWKKKCPWASEQLKPSEECPAKRLLGQE